MEQIPKRSKFPNTKDIAKCNGEDCRAEIVFMKTKNGKRLPVNVWVRDKKFRSPEDGELDYKHGTHEPHHATCPNVDDFR